MLNPHIFGDQHSEKTIKVDPGTFVFGVISIGFAIFIPLKIRANQDKLQSVAWIEKFGRMTKEVDTNYPQTRFFMAWVISRRLALAMLLFLNFGQA